MPPKAAGTVTYIAEKGNYHIDVRGERGGGKGRGGERWREGERREG